MQSHYYFFLRENIFLAFDAELIVILGAHFLASAGQGHWFLAPAK